MKILHVIANLATSSGGPSKACVDMAAAVAAKGHEVHIFTTGQDGTGRHEVPTDVPLDKRGARIHHFPVTVPGRWPISIGLAKALARRIPEFDVVHIHSLYLFHSAVAAHYCRKFGVPYVIRPHGSLDPFLYRRHRFRKFIYESLIERRNFRGAAAIHFTADEERDLAQPFIMGTSSFVVSLGLHLDEYANLPLAGSFRAAFPEIGDRRIVLHLGRLNFKKGLDILVDAFARVSIALDDVHLVLAGPDNEGYGTQIRRRLADRGVSRKATLTGMLQGELKLAALRDAAVFALPSYSENFGIAVVEAMACGVPVVISDRVNIWREVQSAGAGLVIECDAESCAAAILNVLRDDTLRKTMGEHGRTLVTARFDWSMVGEHLEAAYQAIVSAGLQSGGRSAAVAGSK